MKTQDPNWQTSRERVLGRWDGEVEYDEAVFAPMTDEEVAEFEDDPLNPLNQELDSA